MLKFDLSLLRKFVFSQSGIIAESATQRYSDEERINPSDKLLLQDSVIIFWSFSDPTRPQVFNQDFQKFQVFK